MLASFDHAEFPLADLLAAKRETVTACIPVKEAAATIAAVVAVVAELREAGLVDQVLVVDADSADGSGALAAAAGAEVFSESELLPELGQVAGKGDAMWRALAVARGEIVVYLDGDVGDFGPHYVTGLLGPLLGADRFDFVKGFYRRPLALDGVEIPDGGGRVTELTAKPLLELLAPDLAGFHQPLAGEVAARHSLLAAIPYCSGYGVEIAMLLDVWRRTGIERMAEVGLGSKRNDHQSLASLGTMAREVLEALTARLAEGEEPLGSARPGTVAPLGAIRPAAEWQGRLRSRPPMRELQDAAPTTSA